MNKIERDGKVAVLVSPGYGAGWSTQNTEHKEILCMDAEIVQAVLDKDIDKAIKIAEGKCDGYFYEGGAHDLIVEWVPKGTAFEIQEYDGFEALRIYDSRQFMVT